MNRRHLLIFVALLPTACASAPQIVTPKLVAPAPSPASNKFADNSLNRLISKYAAINDVPEALVHRVVKRESTYNPRARNGPYYGLMQIHPQTAQTMGFRGSPNQLLDAETNLKYAVKYLRGAWLLSNGSFDTAVKWYSQGYYYEAKRRGMLVETGLRPAR